MDIALFGYDLAGDMTPVNRAARRITEAAAAAGAPMHGAVPEQPQRPAPPARHGGWRNIPPAWSRWAGDLLTASWAAGPDAAEPAAEPGPTKKAVGAAAALVGATLLLIGAAAGLARGEWSDPITGVTVAGLVVYLLGLRVAGTAVAQARERYGRRAAITLALLTPLPGLGFWVTLARHINDDSRSNVGTWVALAMMIPPLLVLGASLRRR